MRSKVRLDAENGSGNSTPPEKLENSGEVARETLRGRKENQLSLVYETRSVHKQLTVFDLSGIISSTERWDIETHQRHFSSKR